MPGSCMLKRVKQLGDQFLAYTRFCWSAQASRIVFYAEDGGSWSHLGGIVDELVKRGRTLVYLTSSKRDALLTAERDGIDAYWIGDGFVRNVLFQGLKNALMIMTMPDLQSFHVKRSLFSTTHYLYIFHSIVSTHMIYRKQAFDHFDTILCAGPHHEEEIRKREQVYGLKPKRLLKHGYGNLDAIIKEAKDAQRQSAGRKPDTPVSVLVAPSWGPHGILETIGEELSQRLLEAGYKLTIRPHPRTAMLTPSVIERLRSRFRDHDRFRLEQDVESRQSLLRSDVMISDYSGVAFEYAFGLEKPVIFIELPKKANNPDWEELEIPPIELALRREMGYLIEPHTISELPTLIDRLIGEGDQWSDRLRILREQTVYNVGTSAAVGADIVESLFEEFFKG